MASKRNQDANRLSRESTDVSFSRSQTPVDAEMVGSKS
jgi:hypothetical protein